jgi:hypothetical protein
MSNVEVVTAVIAGQLGKINTGRINLVLHGDTPVAVYADVKNGRGPRGAKGEITARLPIIGSREVSRFGDDLDRERAALVVVFTVSGLINGVPYEDVTIWINDGQVTLPTLFSGTDRARQTLYGLGRAVRDEVAVMPGLMDQAWEAHVQGVMTRVAELRRYLDDVTAAAKGQISGVPA